jgi:hypothetical protein
MQCQRCKEEKPEDQFFNLDRFPKDLCIRCIYKEKMNVLKNKKKQCRICGTSIFGQRWIFCSQQCAVKGNIENLNNNWRKAPIKRKNHD